MFKWVLTLCTALASVHLPIGLLTSSSTDDSFLRSIQEDYWGKEKLIEQSQGLSFYLETIWEVFDTSEEDMNKWSLPSTLLGVKIIIDATNDASVSHFLSLRALEYGLVHIVIERSIELIDGELPSANTFYADFPGRSEGLPFIDLVYQNNWNNLALIFDDRNEHKSTAQYIKHFNRSAFTDNKDEIELSISNPDIAGTLKSRLETTTKTAEARVIMILTHSAAAAIALRAGELSGMGGSGYAWVLGSHALLGLSDAVRSNYPENSYDDSSVLFNGAVGFIEETAAEALKNRILTLESVVHLVAQAYQHLGYPIVPYSDVTQQHLSTYFLSDPDISSLPFRVHFDSDRLRRGYFDFYNVQRGIPVKVGYYDYFSRSVVVQGSIVWPGGKTTIPDDKTPVMTFALLYPIHDIEGFYFEESENIRMGFDMAAEEINNDPNMLTGYDLEVIYRDTSMSPEVAPDVFETIRDIDVMGYIGPYASDVAYAYQELLKETENPKPMISYMSSSYFMNSSDTYPEFFRTIQHDGLESVSLLMFLQHNSIKKVSVLYTSDVKGVGLYNSLLSNINSVDLEIINTPDQQRIYFEDGRPPRVSEQTMIDVEKRLSELVEEHAKIFLFLGDDMVAAEIGKVAYRKELYGPEFAWIGSRWLTNRTQYLIQKYYKDEAKNIYTALEGAYGLDYRPTVDLYGAWFSDSYYARWGRNYTISSMYAYDSVMLLADTIEEMLDRGDDIESGERISLSLRSVDFNGISGKVKFVEGSNDRVSIGYSVVNMQDGEIVKVYEYDPLDPTLFVPEPGTQSRWNRAEAPPEPYWPESEEIDCPFPKIMVSISWEGLGIIVSVGTFMFLLTLLISFLSYGKWKNVNIKRIEGEITRSWKDTLVEATIAIEFFQFVAIAPNFPAMKKAVEVAANVFMADAIKISQGDKSSYWELLFIICILCYCWFFLVFLVATDTEYWMRGIPVIQKILNVMNSIVLPFLGNTLFLPITAILLDSMVCDFKAQGYSVVNRDCYMNCWTGDHTTYVTMAAVALALFEPLAVYTRPLWQQARSGLNLMAKPFFLLFKSCVQTLLIAVGKSLQGTTPESHGVVFTILCGLFAYLTYKIRPFNYERCNLYEVASLIAVTYISGVATVSLFYEPTHLGWFFGLCFGWLVIVAGTVMIQKKIRKYKTLLKSTNVRHRNPSFPMLFRGSRHSQKVANFDDNSNDIKGKPPTPADDSVFDCNDKCLDVTNQLQNK